LFAPNRNDEAIASIQQMADRNIANYGLLDA